MSSLNTRFASFLRSRTRHNKRRSPYTIKKYQTKLAPFLSKFGHLEPWSLDAEEVEAWFIARQRRYSEATMHMTRACLLAFLNWISAETGLDCALALAYTPKYDPRPERVRPANPHHVQQALQLTELLTNSDRPQDRRDACTFVLAASNGQRLLPHPRRFWLKPNNYPLATDEKQAATSIIPIRSTHPAKYPYILVNSFVKSAYVFFDVSAGLYQLGAAAMQPVE